MTTDYRDSGNIIVDYPPNVQAVLDRLPQSALDRLDADGESNHEFNSAAFSFALSWLRAGGSEDDYVTAVVLSHLGQTYTRSDLERRLSKTFSDAEDKADFTDRNPEKVRDNLRAVLRRVEQSDLSPSVKQTAVALVEIGIEVGTWAVDASTRRIAERTGAQFQTVAGHLQTLKNTDLVSETVLNGTGKARTFVLNLGYVLDDEDHADCHRKPLSDNSLLWSKHGLGATARKIQERAPWGVSSVKALTKATGSDRRTLNKHLSNLVAAGIFVATDEDHPRYAVNLLADPEHALAASGAVENQNLRKQQYETEREQYAEFKAAGFEEWKQAQAKVFVSYWYKNLDGSEFYKKHGNYALFRDSFGVQTDYLPNDEPVYYVYNADAYADFIAGERWCMNAPEKYREYISEDQIDPWGNYLPSSP